ncbi:PorP/SprF family type IX secretion system membrane protein [Pontibacter anaerobius]|uniref:Type IX secretion system membrane protein PorP/SprF n=1 Tax=Pontibacter anaerobius TaxID=2993940 RepID=A0ABT3RH95_9BACT|nr:type IX secretion system membrane protein PorP/SprF [Pontibacter anaerobius]MCX2741140.1 type IX secretion system membrane protein PorP/SprF [Pontibacter anaerobius]
MNKLLALGVMLLVAAGSAFAQQRPQYTQYTLNNYLANPAITGIEDYADLKLGTRQQWSGLEGAPQSYYATLHMPINKPGASPSYGSRRSMAKESSMKPSNIYRRSRPHHGFGLMAMSTETGPLKRGSVSASYAYHQPITRTIKVSAGVQPGIIQYSLDPARVKLANNSLHDPAIYDGRVNEVKFDLGMGLWLYSRNFYAGVAGAQLVPSKRQYLADNTPSDNDGSLQQHYYVTGGYRLDVAPYISLIPSVMVKVAQPSPLSVDATMKVVYGDRLWGGVTYRHKESVAAMAGINISPLLDLAYSYDAGTSPLGHTNAGSHEVVLGFKLRNTRKIICPEWAW